MGFNNNKGELTVINWHLHASVRSIFFADGNKWCINLVPAVDGLFWFDYNLLADYTLCCVSYTWLDPNFGILFPLNVTHNIVWKIYKL